MTAGDISVTLASNVNHSVYAATALNNMNILSRYLGPVIFDKEASRLARVSERLERTRLYSGVSRLPLQRLAVAEGASRVITATRMGRERRVVMSAKVLDWEMSRKAGMSDVFHFNTSGLVRTVTAARRLASVVIADHRDVHPRHHEQVDPLLKGLEIELSTADFVIANSEYAAASLNTYGVPEERIVVLPLGVDVEIFSPGSSDAARRSREGTPLKILFVGSVVRRKGVDILLDALDHPLIAASEVRIVGSLSDIDLAGRCALTRNVSVMGPQPRDQIVEQYRWADVLALPSRIDAFGLVAVEALACGTPVVVTSTCGVASLIQDGAGLVVPPGDPDCLAEALHTVGTASRSEGSGARAREVAIGGSWQAYGDRLSTWYENVVLPKARERRCTRAN